MIKRVARAGLLKEGMKPGRHVWQSPAGLLAQGRHPWQQPGGPMETLNAWGQNVATAKLVRKQLRQERANKRMARQMRKK